MMGRKYWALVAVLCICAFVGAGCKRKSSKNSTITRNDDDIFTTDGFPGADVQNGNVADDGRAMSVSGNDFAGSFQSFPNGDRGTTMVTYRTADGRLYAHYYNGETWTPPVALDVLDANLATAGALTAVAWINTDDDGNNSFAQDRNGDAVILWTVSDAAGLTAADGVNTVLIATYFDVTDSSDISQNFGFQSLGTRISTIEDEAAENVSTFGWISDGLCGEARWSNGANGYKWGDQTHELVAFWRQDSDNDGFAGFQSDQYWAFSRWDIGGAVDAEIALTPGAMTRGGIIGFGASDSGVTSEETQVDSDFISYNMTLFFRVASDGDAGSGGVGAQVAPAMTGYGALSAEDDITCQEVTFSIGTGTPSPVASLQAVTPSSLVGDTFQTNACLLTEFGTSFVGTGASTYGSDEGLACIVNISLQLGGNDPNVGFGEVTFDGRVRLTEVNQTSGALFAGTFLDGEDSDISDSVFNGEVNSRISRNGDYIWVAWDLETVDIAPTGPGVGDYSGLWVNQYITTRIDSDGVSPIPGALGTTTSGPIVVSNTIAGSGISGHYWQENLGYICGAQSNPDVMNLFLQQSDLTNDTAFFVRLTADLIPSASPSPVPLGAALEVFQEGDQSSLNFQVAAGTTANFAATDSGEGGNFIAFYRLDIDGTAATDFRMFSEKTGIGTGRVEIDSNTVTKQVPSQVIRLAATPAGTDIGTFDIVSLDDDSARVHGNSFVHAFFFENSISEVDGLANSLKTRQHNTGDDTVSFGDTFAPNAGTLFTVPFDMDLPYINPATNGPSVLFIGRSGDTVGVYFQELFRIYYTEANPDGNNSDDVSWITSEGVSNPFLVDDDNDEEVTSTIGIFPMSCTCDTLSGAMAFWTKQYGSGGSGSQTLRLQVRVRAGAGNN